MIAAPVRPRIAASQDATMDSTRHPGLTVPPTAPILQGLRAPGIENEIGDVELRTRLRCTRLPQ